jgi:hypothetical protein
MAISGASRSGRGARSVVQSELDRLQVRFEDEAPRVSTEPSNLRQEPALSEGRALPVPSPAARSSRRTRRGEIDRDVEHGPGAVGTNL